MKELIQQVQEWANERGLNKPDQAKAQFLKVLSEYGETCDAIIKREKNGDDDLIDGFGDTLVTLIVLYQMISIDITELYRSGEKENYLDFSEFIADLDKLRLRLKYPDSGWGLLEIQCNDTIRELATHIQAFGFTPEQCLQAAYNEIKDRKGVTMNGTFIKDEAQSVAETKSDVDLSELRIGDTVVFATGSKVEVLDIVPRGEKFKLFMIDEIDTYCRNGNWLRVDKSTEFDIVKIIKQVKA